MRSRGLAVRRAAAWMAGLVCCLLLILSGAASASNTGSGPYGPSDPSPCFGSLCKAPCHLTYAADCESRDPNVTINYPAAQDCAYAGNIDWGDGTSQPVSFGSLSGSGGDSDLTHQYGSTEDYEATLSGSFTCAGEQATTPFSATYDIGILAGHYDLVAIGDSYSAGEGAGHYEASHPNCHRSSVAWPRLLPHYTQKIRSVLLLACSGATSRALNGHVANQPNQLNILRGIDPSLITLTIGGNDVNFAGVLTNCFVRNCVTDGRLKTLDNDIKENAKQFEDDYLAVMKAAPHARLLVIGYPQLFPTVEDFRNYPECGYLTRNGTPPPTDDSPAAKLARYEELIELAYGDALLDATIEEGVALANLRLARDRVYNRITYVSAYEALSGHEFCTALPWLVNVDLLRGAIMDKQLGHPNEAGQRAIAEVVSRYVNQYL